RFDLDLADELVSTHLGAEIPLQAPRLVEVNLSEVSAGRQSFDLPHVNGSHGAARRRQAEGLLPQIARSEDGPGRYRPAFLRPVAVLPPVEIHLQQHSVELGWHFGDLEPDFADN